MLMVYTICIKKSFIKNSGALSVLKVLIFYQIEHKSFDKRLEQRPGIRLGFHEVKPS